MQKVLSCRTRILESCRTFLINFASTILRNADKAFVKYIRYELNHSCPYRDDDVSIWQRKGGRGVVWPNKKLMLMEDHVMNFLGSWTLTVNLCKEVFATPKVGMWLPQQSRFLKWETGVFSSESLCQQLQRSSHVKCWTKNWTSSVMERRRNVWKAYWGLRKARTWLRVRWVWMGYRFFCPMKFFQFTS